MKIEIHVPDKETLEERGVSSWPIWEKEVSRFDWYYDSIEECYLLEGHVEVETADGGKVQSCAPSADQAYHYPNACRRLYMVFSLYLGPKQIRRYSFRYKIAPTSSCVTIFYVSPEAL